MYVQAVEYNVKYCHILTRTLLPSLMHVELAVDVFGRNARHDSKIQRYLNILDPKKNIKNSWKFSVMLRTQNYHRF